VNFFSPHRALVNITNLLDPGQEVLSIALTPPGVNVTREGAVLSLEGALPVSVYTSVLQSLTYQHLDSNPGNPDSSQIRFGKTFLHVQFLLFFANISDVLL